MNYTSAYDRGQLAPINPELNYSPGLYGAGRKRFAVHKNLQSSGVSYGASDYYLRQYQQELEALKPKNEEAAPTNEAAAYKPENAYINPYQRNAGVTANPVSNSGNYPNSSYQDQPNYSQKYTGSYTAQEPENRDDIQPVRQAESNDEVRRLREELARKEAELQAFKHNQPALAKQPPSKHDQYIRINKDQWDRQLNTESKLTTLTGLNLQLEQKKQANQLAQLQREQETAKRLEDLVKLRNDEQREWEAKIQREREYREDLTTQSKLRQQISKAETFYDRATLAPEEVSPPPPRFRSIPAPDAKNAFERNINDFYASPYTSPLLAVPRFTKKAPKTICYNPITGNLKDTSAYIFGAPVPVIPHKSKENPFVPIAKNQYRVPADFSEHPAFQQPRFTKLNPKPHHSNPITGETQKLILTDEFQESLAKFYGMDEPISRNPSRKSLAEYGHMILQANGRNPAWTEN